ncbi:hypothetical protein B0J13DRAFT_645287 [Dactylonectria estremocensis]|uniref:CHAT domain-containing protein n=1 Tax=Dactylonectria estremocensis TaxID=1079267 RepID=A0A9P9E1L1_9HYPO|nr:hypothetical protein B0J13DRAFT_645287 [Dactylonectria estremocensis]
MIPEDSPEFEEHMYNLGTQLRTRYERFGSLDDLNRANRAIKARTVVLSTPESNNSYATTLDELNLERWLAMRPSGGRTVVALHLDVEIGRIELHITRDEYNNRVAWLDRMSSLLRHRHLRTGATPDLDDAIAIAEQVFEMTYDDDPHCPDMSTSLEEAITVAKQVVEAAPVDDPNLAKHLNNLGNLLSDRFSHTGATADKEQSTGCFIMALQSVTSLITMRIHAGCRLLAAPEVLRSGHGAFEMAQATVNLVPLLPTGSIFIRVKQHLLSDTVSLASDAAATALHLGKEPAIALELLETGYGDLANSFHSSRPEVSTLQVKHPLLARDFEYSCFQLHASSIAENLASTDKVSVSSRSRAAYQDFNASHHMFALLNEIRSHDNFSQFLQPPTKREGCESAYLGPIVVVNVSSDRCDALIIERSNVRALNLPHLFKEAIAERGTRLYAIETLHWLWDVIVDPVLKALGFTGPPPADSWPHVWWIPTGILRNFPLHAAGYHEKLGDNTTLDRVVSSYNSSVRAIITTRRLPQRPVTRSDSSESVFIVAMDETPGRPNLRFAFDEIKAVQSACFLAGLSPTVRIQPRREDTLEHLATCQLFHFLDTIRLVAGFRHVIGTLWWVHDRECVDMARLTYEYLANKGLHDASVSGALHRATRILRGRWVADNKREGEIDGPGMEDLLGNDGVKTSPHWASYIHFGV